MSSDDLADFWQHTVSVETYARKSGSGVVLYAPAVSVPGLLTRKQTFVRNANGDQVVSSASYSADVSWADTLAPKSRVTIPGQAQPTTVISRQVSTGGNLIEGVDRVKVFLQ